LPFRLLNRHVGVALVHQIIINRFHLIPGYAAIMGGSLINKLFGNTRKSQTTNCNHPGMSAVLNAREVIPLWVFICANQFKAFA
jgi:hypothetical protein